MGLVLSRLHEKQRPEPGAELANSIGTERLAENQEPEPGTEVAIPSCRQRYSTKYVPLHKAALIGDWKTAEKLLQEDPRLVTARITEGEEIALHIAVLQGHAYFVANLLKKMAISDLVIENSEKKTALCLAASTGHIDIAKLMVGMNPNLPKIRSGKVTALYLAARHGRNEMAKYLFPLSGFGSWAMEDQTELLTTAINSGLYGLAVSIVKQFRILGAREDNFRETPLQILARKPSAFCDSSRQGLWDNIANTILPFRKLKTCNTSTPCRNTSTPCDAHTLLHCLWDCVMSQEDVEKAENQENILTSFFQAAKYGNDEFLVELIKRNPNLIYKVNYSRHTIFHIAVLHRYVKVLNLIHELHGVKDLIVSRIDDDGNNILHLAAKLAPQNQLNSIPTASFQMQREGLWYKEVEKIVQSSYRDKRNLNRQTPHELFLAEHKNLMKEGKEEMKHIANSCMIVATLIVTVVFTVAFAVPGGYNSEGVPVLKDKKLFMIIPISEAVATLASFTSILMFLSMLTSRFSENEFLRLLPSFLVVGMASLFVSIVAIIVAFCTSLLFYQCGLGVIIIVLILFASVPIMFVVLKCHLLVTILGSTYSSRWLFRSNNRLFS